MKFKIDENLPVEVAELLRQAGYDVTTVLDQDLGGSSDADLATICQKERRVFITLDIDFGDIRAYPPAQWNIAMRSQLGVLQGSTDNNICERLR